MLLAIVVFFVIALLDKSTSRLHVYSRVSAYAAFFYFSNFILLMWLGGKPVEAPYIFLSQILVSCNFLWVFIWIPFMSLIESYALTSGEE
jgi:quinol-cytochrome oxidoreductase complex cytochrome b subunit